MDAFERLLWWLFVGRAGARTRLEVLPAIREEPRNVQQLALLLNVDYTTARHHLRVLLKNRLVQTVGEKYGRIYLASEVMESNWAALEQILERTRRNQT